MTCFQLCEASLRLEVQTCGSWLWSHLQNKEGILAKEKRILQMKKHKTCLFTQKILWVLLTKAFLQKANLLIEIPLFERYIWLFIFNRVSNYNSFPLTANKLDTKILEEKKLTSDKVTFLSSIKKILKNGMFCLKKGKKYTKYLKYTFICMI